MPYQPDDLIENNVGLLLGDRSNDDPVSATGVKLQFAGAIERVMDNLDRCYKRFPPAVAGRQDIFPAAGVFEPCFLAVVKVDS